MKSDKKILSAAKALEALEEGNYAEAEQHFLRLLYLLDEKETVFYQQVVYGLGMTYAMQGNYDGAKACFEEGRINARKVQDIHHELAMFRQLVTICREEGKWEAASMLNAEEILYRQKYAPDNLMEIAHVYFEGANIHLQTNNSQRCKKYLEEAVIAYESSVTINGEQEDLKFKEILLNSLHNVKKRIK